MTIGHNRFYLHSYSLHILALSITYFCLKYARFLFPLSIFDPSVSIKRMFDPHSLHGSPVEEAQPLPSVGHVREAHVIKFLQSLQLFFCIMPSQYGRISYYWFRCGVYTIIDIYGVQSPRFPIKPITGFDSSLLQFT